MKSAKNSTKNVAAFSLIAHLKPVLYNKNRWSGKFNMFDYFVKISADLIVAAVDIENDMEVEDRLNFLRMCQETIESWKEWARSQSECSFRVFLYLAAA